MLTLGAVGMITVGTQMHVQMEDIWICIYNGKLCRFIRMRVPKWMGWATLLLNQFLAIVSKFHLVDSVIVIG